MNKFLLDISSQTFFDDDFVSKLCTRLQVSNENSNDWGYKINVKPCFSIEKAAVPQIDVGDLADVFLPSDYYDTTSADIHGLIKDDVSASKCDTVWLKRRQVLDKLNSVMVNVLNSDTDSKDSSISYSPGVAKDSSMPAIFQNRIDKSLIELRSAGCVNGGGTGREFLRNLHNDSCESWDKWFHPGSIRTSWVEATFTGGDQVVYGYALCSANDAPHRDPVKWTLEGFNRETNVWEVLHSVQIDFTARWQWHAFAISNPKHVTKVKLIIDQVREVKDGVQLGHFHLFGSHLVPPGSVLRGVRSDGDTFSWSSDKEEVIDNPNDVVLTIPIYSSVAVISVVDDSRKAAALNILCTSLTKAFAKSLPSPTPTNIT